MPSIINRVSTASLKVTSRGLTPSGVLLGISEIDEIKATSRLKINEHIDNYFMGYKIYYSREKTFLAMVVENEE